MIGKRKAALAAALAVSLAAPGAGATTSCSFGTMVSVAFGSYDVFATSPLDSTGSISYSCLGVGASDTIIITLSSGNASGFAPRQLLSGSNVLTYNLFLDGARTSIWGDGTGSTAYYGPFTPTSGQTHTVTVYGRISALQNAVVGTYGDTVVATIVF